MGAYSQDVIGYETFRDPASNVRLIRMCSREFCYALKGQNIPAKNNTTCAYSVYWRSKLSYFDLLSFRRELLSPDEGQLLATSLDFVDTTDVDCARLFLGKLCVS